MIGIFVYYLHRKNRKMATGDSSVKKQLCLTSSINNYLFKTSGTLLNKSDADVALVDHSSIYEKKVKI